MHIPLKECCGGIAMTISLKISFIHNRRRRFGKYSGTLLIILRNLRTIYWGILPIAVNTMVFLHVRIVLKGANLHHARTTLTKESVPARMYLFISLFGSCRLILTNIWNIPAIYQVKKCMLLAIIMNRPVVTASCRRPSFWIITSFTSWTRKQTRSIWR